MHIRSATFQLSAPDLASCPDSELPEFALIGRSNVGKSSLINLLAGGSGGGGKKKDLAKVSATPGHTRLINFFSMDGKWNLVDLPGYGFTQAGKGERDRFQQRISEYMTGRENLACVLVLIDSRHAPQAIDLDFVQWLSVEAGVPYALVFTKTDLSKPNRVKENIELFTAEVEAWGREIPAVFTSSAKTRLGRPELLEFIEHTLKNATH